MLNLRELQIAFQDYLLTQKITIQSEITSTKKVAVETRLEIYREAYYLRLLEVLQQDYETLHTVLGDEQFNQLGRNYIQAYPSKYRSIRWFSQYLPDYINQTSNQDFLYELAQFEHLLTESFDAKNGTVVTIDEMAAITPEKWPDLYFKLHPTVQRLDVTWNIIAIWNAVKNKEDVILPKKLDTKTNILIWRNELQTQFYSLSEVQAEMLDAIELGKNFGAICEDLCKWTDESNVGMLAAQLLKQFILDNILSQVYSQ